MSLAKRIKDLPKNHPYKQRGEYFLSGKYPKDKIIIKKGDFIEIYDNPLLWQIIKYPSNSSILIECWEGKICHQKTINKDQIKEIK